ncbi:hypothetical protein Ddc_12157 [Ditylenchus destructor]|nr:hypothetical protein Ddc_12157 [Ditylenchus destructor]
MAYLPIIFLILVFGFSANGEETHILDGQEVVITDDYREAAMARAQTLLDQQEKFDWSADTWRTYQNNKFTTGLHSYASDLSKEEVTQLLATLKELLHITPIIAIYNMNRLQDEFLKNHPEIPRYATLGQFILQKIKMMKMLKEMATNQLTDFCTYFENCNETLVMQTEASKGAPTVEHFLLRCHVFPDHWEINAVCCVSLQGEMVPLGGHIEERGSVFHCIHDATSGITRTSMTKIE